jgi:glycerophosphoryl diester phosphodiesterase
MGHGGMGAEYRYPMNTMKSLNEVLELGTAGTEMDVELTRDNVLVLYHNIALEDATGCDGKVRDKNWEDIRNCKYKLPLLSGAGLIAAEAFFLQRANLKNHIFTFDTKVNVDDGAEDQQRFANALYSLIQRFDLVENCFIESYSSYFLKIMSLKNNKLKLFVHSDNYADCLDILKDVPLYGVTMDRTRISKEQIADAHKRGLHVTLFNLYSESDNLEGIKMNPDFMQSDKCDFLINALN